MSLSRNTITAEERDLQNRDHQNTHKADIMKLVRVTTINILCYTTVLHNCTPSHGSTDRSKKRSRSRSHDRSRSHEQNRSPRSHQQRRPRSPPRRRYVFSVHLEVVEASVCVIFHYIRRFHSPEHYHQKMASSDRYHGNSRRRGSAKDDDDESRRTPPSDQNEAES